jgi:competence protein ComEA
MLGKRKKRTEERVGMNADKNTAGKKNVTRETVIMWGLVAVCLCLTAFNVLPRLQPNKSVLERSQPTITVSVAGEVNTPGTYTLPWGATTQDAIRSAGGFSEAAASTLVNLAEPLDTGEQVFVPALTTETGTERVSVNSAPAALLDTLPGVGPATAQRIIEGRPYSSLEQLLNVKGIGEKTLEKLRPFVTL